MLPMEANNIDRRVSNAFHFTFSVKQEQGGLT
jgi:hypothetical protein